MSIGIPELLLAVALAGAVAMIALLARPRAAVLYPAMQITGWVLYGVVKYLAANKGVLTVPRVTLLVVIGLAISLALNAAIDRLFARGLSAPLIILGAILVTPFGACAWLALYNLLIDGPKTLNPEGVMNKTLALLSWCVVHVGIRVWNALAAERVTAAEAQLEALRYQLEPHFLFNALNSVSAMVDEDPPRAKQMVRDLSDFLRDTLRGGANDVPLSQEIASVQRYLGIEKIRFEDRLDVDVRIDPAAANVAIPGFLLHPLVENAVKYGMKTSAMPLRIAVTAERNNGSLTIEVRNSGKLAANGDGFGIGVDNVRRRLAQRYPGRHAFVVGEDANGVAARVEIRT